MGRMSRKSAGLEIPRRFAMPRKKKPKWQQELLNMITALRNYLSTNANMATTGICLRILKTKYLLGLFL